MDVAEYDVPWCGVLCCRSWQHVDVGFKVLYDSIWLGSGVVMLINATRWLLQENWQDSRIQNVTDVTLSCQVLYNNDQCSLKQWPVFSITMTSVLYNNDQWCPHMYTDSSTHHNTTSTKWHDLLNATSCQLFSSLAVNALSSINCEQTVPAFLTEDYPLPVTWLPMSYNQSPFQSQTTMCIVSKCPLWGL